MGKRIGVYAGSFDPPTSGHLWVIERGLELFDELIVAVGTNPDKSYTFSLERRIAMLEETLESRPRASASCGVEMGFALASLAYTSGSPPCPSYA